MNSAATSTDRTPEFVRLLMQHERRIYAYVRSLVPNRTDAEDVLQETSRVLWEKFEQYKSGTDFVAWAFQVARYEVSYYRRRQQGDRLRFSDEFVDLLADEAQGEEEHLAGTQAALSECLEKLPPRDRDLLTQRYEPGASVQGIAEQLRRPVQTIYSRLKRVRRALFACVQRTLAAEGRG